VRYTSIFDTSTVSLIKRRLYTAFIMTVSKKHHKRVLYIQGVAIIILCILFVLALIQLDVLNIGNDETPLTEEETVMTEYPEAPESPFLGEEEVVVIESKTESEEEVVLPIKKVLFEYVEVTDGCGTHFEGECLNVRSGPGTEYPVISQLRNDIVLKVDGKVERDGQTWFKIVFDEYLRYPERVKGDWYVAADYVEVLLDEGDKTIWEDGNASTTKEIIVDRSAQTLTASEDGEIFMDIKISTGLELTPTPRGTFSIFKKTPSRYMQGPLPNLIDKQVYDLPGVPWNLYFTHGGAVIHGAYWHNSFGSAYSHGCVNLSPEDARKLYNWAELGTTVIVRD
jgi:hypothetical protein